MKVSVKPQDPKALRQARARIVEYDVSNPDQNINPKKEAIEPPFFVNNQENH